MKPNQSKVDANRLKAAPNDKAEALSRKFKKLAESIYGKMTKCQGFEDQILVLKDGLEKSFLNGILSAKDIVNEKLGIKK